MSPSALGETDHVKDRHTHTSWPWQLLTSWFVKVWPSVQAKRSQVTSVTCLLMLTWDTKGAAWLHQSHIVARPKSQTVRFSHWLCLIHNFLWLSILSSSLSPSLSLPHLATRVFLSHLMLSCHLNASGFDNNRFIFGVAFIVAIIFLYHYKWRHSVSPFPRGHKLKKKTNCERILRCDWHFFCQWLYSFSSPARLCIKSLFGSKELSNNICNQLPPENGAGVSCWATSVALTRELCHGCNLSLHYTCLKVVSAAVHL